VRARLRVAQLFGLELQLERALLQLDEHARLGAQHLGPHRFHHEIECAELVALEDLVVLPGQAGDEDDRRGAVARARANQARGLEAVHAGHRDVEDDQREVLLEQSRERLDAGACEHQLAAERRECSFDGDQVRVVVVDDQDVPAVGHQRPTLRLVQLVEQPGR